jgi:hypothetical protein
MFNCGMKKIIAMSESLTVSKIVVWVILLSVPALLLFLLLVFLPQVRTSYAMGEIRKLIRAFRGCEK